MFTIRPSLIALVAAAGMACSAVAGPLVPPAGPVGSTMKTLTEVEPRIPINSTSAPGDADSVFKITAPGSYYLTGNVVVAGSGIGIQIAANDVTLDLNGFTITGFGSTGSIGIADTLDETNQISRVTVRNGFIDNFSDGVHFDWLGSGTVTDLAISRVVNGVSWNGGGTVLRCTATSRSPSTGAGFSIDGGGRLESCEAVGFLSGYFSVRAPTIDCISRNCVNGFILSTATASHCSALGVTNTGFQVGSDSVVEDSTAEGGTVGVELSGFRGIVRRSTIVRPSSYGIRVGTGTQSIIEDNTVIGDQGANQTGIRLDAIPSRCVIQRNCGVNNGYGILVLGSDNTIVGNCFGKSVGSNAIYSFAAGNRFGPLVRAGTGVTATANASSSNVAGSFTNTDTSANIFY